MKGNFTSPKLSILICSKDRRNRLESLVAQLKALVPMGKAEIVIVEETDRPAPIDGARYVSHPVRHLGFAHARNLALEQARGELLIFLDDDVTVSGGWLDEIVKPFDDPGVGAVGGAILPEIDGINGIGRCVSLLGFPAGGLSRYLRAEGEPQDSELLSTGNCAVRAQLARDVGRFDLFLRWGGEDQDFFRRVRLRARTLFVPRACVFHRQRDSLRSVFSWFIRRGKADYFRTCKDRGPLQALVLPLRSSFLLKVLLMSAAVLSLGVSLPAAAVLAVPLFFGAWSVLLLRRFLPGLSREFNALPADIRRVKDELLKGAVRWLLPVTRLVMDIGSEVGRIQAFGIYVRNRFFTRPVILAFHDIRPSEAAEPAKQDDYTCSVRQFLQMIEDARREGRRVVPLTEITRRLRTSPASLSFERVAAVTFDDGYRSVHALLSRALSDGAIAVSVFLPTALAGSLNVWDVSRTSDRREIMTSREADDLRRMGATIGAHTRSHADLLDLSARDARREIEGSFDDLKKHVALPGDGEILFSYPYGRYNQGMIDFVREAGFTAAFTNLPGHPYPGMNRWRIPRFTVRSGMTWADVRSQSRALWLRELAREIRWKWMDARRPMAFRQTAAPSTREGRHARTAP
jgi:peptidoglycan/xylan/chitin deacetylase (PgdA/CDA1 family)/GT2 family glycosyltransferase